MAKGEETDEHCRACVEKDALIATLQAGVAALKTTQGAMRAAMAAMEKRRCQWAELPRELLGMVLEKLQEAPLAGGVEGSKDVRLMSREWRASHDAMVTRLTVAWETTDEGMWLLARRFPAVMSLETKADIFRDGNVTNEGLRAVRTLTGLTSLNISGCYGVTDDGIQAVSTLTWLKSLNLTCCDKVTNDGIRSVSSLTGLTSLTLRACRKVTHAGLEALRRDTASSNLRIQWP
jgi:hypothetical protein